MWTHRTLLVLTTVLGMLVAARFLRRGEQHQARASLPVRALPSLTGIQPDPNLTALVQRSLQHLEGPAAQWRRGTVWLHVHASTLRYQAEGTFHAAPGRRHRLELRTRPLDARGGSATGTLLTVCDGRALWHARQAGSEAWLEVRRYPLAELAQTATASNQLRQAMASGGALGGPVAIVRGLQDHLAWLHRENEGEHIHLVGAVRPERIGLPVGTRQSWPEALPRICRLTLTGSQLWPGRIEWWGPDQEGGEADRLLIEMEFRDPVLGKSLPEAEAARLFRVPAAVATAFAEQEAKKDRHGS